MMEESTETLQVKHLKHWSQLQTAANDILGFFCIFFLRKYKDWYFM